MNAEINEIAYAEVLHKFPPHPIRDDEGNARATAMLMRLVSDPDQTIEQKAVAEVLITLIGRTSSATLSRHLTRSAPFMN